MKQIKLALKRFFALTAVIITISWVSTSHAGDSCIDIFASTYSRADAILLKSLIVDIKNQHDALEVYSQEFKTEFLKDHLNIHTGIDAKFEQLNTLFIRYQEFMGQELRKYYSHAYIPTPVEFIAKDKPSHYGDIKNLYDDFVASHLVRISENIHPELFFQTIHSNKGETFEVTLVAYLQLVNGELASPAMMKQLDQNARMIKNTVKVLTNLRARLDETITSVEIIKAPEAN